MNQVVYCYFMAAINFNFQQYIVFRKGMKQAQNREGASYAFSADLRMLRKVQRLGPISALLEEANRFFQKKLLPSLLKESVRIIPNDSTKLFFLMNQCAQRLHILTPPIYITKNPSIEGPITLGTLEEMYVFIPESLLDRFSEEEWFHLLGIQAGHIQNDHVLLLTAWYYLISSANGLVQLLVLPAKSILDVWLKRANITGDRAGLLCTRSVESSTRALSKFLSKEEEQMVRQEALSIFSQTQYFHLVQNQPGGDPLAVCDDKVALLFDRAMRAQEKNQ